MPLRFRKTNYGVESPIRVCIQFMRWLDFLTEDYLFFAQQDHIEGSKVNFKTAYFVILSLSI